MDNCPHSYYEEEIKNRAFINTKGKRDAKSGKQNENGGWYMIDIKNKGYCPVLEEIIEYIDNPVFSQFCVDIKTKYKCNEKIEFSSCSWEFGWNVKFKKSGKNLCTIYPKKGYFTVLVVIGQKEKEAAEAILLECTAELRDFYEQTKTGNGQKWLMIDLEGKEKIYEDIFHLIDIRRG